MRRGALTELRVRRLPAPRRFERSDADAPSPNAASCAGKRLRTQSNCSVFIAAAVPSSSEHDMAEREGVQARKAIAPNVSTCGILARHSNFGLQGSEPA